MELDFYRAIEILNKVKRKKDYLTKVEELKQFVFTRYSPWHSYRLALELDTHGYDVSDLENHIIKLGAPHYLISFALGIRSANIPKLQEAVIRSRSAANIAAFACFVKNADGPRLEECVAELKNPQGAYTLLANYKNVDVEKFRPIIMKSKRPRYLYQLSKHTTNAFQLTQIEDLILRSKSFFYMRLFWQNTPSADLVKLENRVLASGNLKEIKKTYALTGSKRLGRFVMLS
jgi:hypothetical protein